jgi:hypothetical protein
VPEPVEEITLRTDCNPWEQQTPVESDRDFSRFACYRDVDPESDRIRQTLEILNSTGDKISLKELRRLQSNYRWAPRAAAFDRYAMLAERAKLVRRRRKAIDDSCKTAERLRGKALQALDMIEPVDMTVTDIVKCVDLAHRMEQAIYRDAAALPANAKGASATTAADGTDVRDIAALTPAERRARLEALRHEVVSRATRAVDDDEVIV